MLNAAAAAKSASVVSDSVWPHRRQPTRLPVPGILQARILEWAAISFNAWKWKVKVKSLSGPESKNLDFNFGKPSEL